jgi:hypothetical protein
VGGAGVGAAVGPGAGAGVGAEVCASFEAGPSLTGRISSEDIALNWAIIGYQGPVNFRGEGDGR